VLETLVVSAAERLLTRGHRERELLGVDPLRALARSRLNACSSMTKPIV